MGELGRNERCYCGSGKKYKKCCMNRDNRKPHETLKKFFGEEWIEKQLEKVKLDGYHNMNPMNLAKVKFHPVIRAIVGTQIKLSRAKKTGTVALGKDELLQNLLHENLTLLESSLDLPDVQRRLRDEKEYPKVEYEIAIAAGYVRCGNAIEFIPRSTTGRTGEFYATSKDGLKVLVECKKKDMTSPKEQKLSAWWEEFQHLLMEKMKSEKRFYCLELSIPFDPDRSETHQLVKEIQTLLAESYEGEKDLLNKYKVQFEKAESPEQLEQFAKESDMGVSRILYDKNTGVISEMMKISGKFPSDFIEEKVSSVISTLGQAYGQLEDDKPNIVYVDINVAAMTPERARVIMSKLPPEIKKKLDKDYSKISAVVLTDLKLLGHADMMGIHADEAVILNEKAKNPISKDFRVYGDEATNSSILGDLRSVLQKS